MESVCTFKDQMSQNFDSSLFIFLPNLLPTVIGLCIAEIFVLKNVGRSVGKIVAKLSENTIMTSLLVSCKIAGNSKRS